MRNILYVLMVFQSDRRIKPVIQSPKKTQYRRKESSGQEEIKLLLRLKKPHLILFDDQQNMAIRFFFY